MYLVIGPKILILLSPLYSSSNSLLSLIGSASSKYLKFSHLFWQLWFHEFTIYIAIITWPAKISTQVIFDLYSCSIFPLKKTCDMLWKKISPASSQCNRCQPDPSSLSTSNLSAFIHSLLVFNYISWLLLFKCAKRLSPFLSSVSFLSDLFMKPYLWPLRVRNFPSNIP